MTKRLVCLLLALCLMVSSAPLAMAAEVPTESQVYASIIAMKEQYPEGTPWTNEIFYEWNGYAPQNGVIEAGGYGCVAFAFILSDIAFGNLPAQYLNNITIDSLRVGDILRMENDTHTVIILEKHDNYVIIAEGNFNSSVHWGRKLTAEEVASADYAMTRYPQTDSEEPDAPSIPSSPSVSDLTSWRNVYYSTIQTFINQEDQEDWTASQYNLIDIDGDDIPELYVIHEKSSSLVNLYNETVRITMLSGGTLTYLEGQNILHFAGDVSANYYNASYQIKYGTLFMIPSNEYNQNYAETMKKEGKDAADGARSYEAFIQLLCDLEAGKTPDEEKPPVTESVFTDVVPGAFYEKAVDWAVEKGITNGRTETTFAPGDSCGRSEVVTFLYRAQGKPAVSNADTGFTDVKSGKFYTDAVAWAVENKITNGMGDGTFGVSQNCTRAQVVTFLWRAAGSPEPTATDCPFTDVKTSGFYYKAVLWAVEKGITKGMSDTIFGVGETCTRGQIVTFLYRFAG